MSRTMTYRIWCAICAREVQLTHAVGKPRLTCAQSCAYTRHAQQRAARDAERKAKLGPRHCTCVVCGASFEHARVRGNVPFTCSEACAKARRRGKRHDEHAGRYPALREAGAGTELAKWGSQGGQIRFEEAMRVLREEKQ